VLAAELGDFILQLRADIMGLGTFARRFDHLAEARNGFYVGQIGD
jgi:elongation factor G